MKRPMTRLMLASAVALLLSAGDACASEKPFKSVGLGDGQLVFDGNDPIGFIFSAAGVATHLGAWTNVGAAQIDGVDEDGNLCVSGVAIFTAANGDMLYADIKNGKIDPTTGKATAKFVWTKGTGLFANVSGETDMDLTQGPFGPTGAFEFDFTLDGHIDY